ncbi:hypothetical protein NDU88_011668 [Pleurodeles waltl]|uniref:Uncharacterized protein n=1 Tax=Pleurodeles waltl TaxID=8319 RepID=A0AAV7QYC1_PLEWA|nr:hypothetical protein NDU88_011668 [Pleurodeles waltl]
MVLRTPQHRCSMSELLPRVECGNAGPKLLGLKLKRREQQRCAGAAQVMLKKGEQQAWDRGCSGGAEEMRAAKKGRRRSGQVVMMKVAKQDRRSSDEVIAVRAVKQGRSRLGEKSMG